MNTKMAARIGRSMENFFYALGPGESSSHERPLRLLQPGEVYWYFYWSEVQKGQYFFVSGLNGSDDGGRWSHGSGEFQERFLLLPVSCVQLFLYDLFRTYARAALR